MNRPIIILAISWIAFGPSHAQSLNCIDQLTYEVSPGARIGDQRIYAVEFLLGGMSDSSDLRIGRSDDGLDWPDLGPFIRLTAADIFRSRSEGFIDLTIYRVVNPDSVSTCESSLLLAFNAFTCENCLPESAISGAVTWVNECQNSAGQPLVSWLVSATNTSLPESVYHTLSDSNGGYTLYLPNGEYDLEVIPRDSNWLNCQQSTRSVALNDTILKDQDFAFFPGDTICNQLFVNISTSILRPCFETTYFVHYGNYSTTPAKNVFVDVLLDSALVFQNSMHPFTKVDGNIFRFEIGDLGVGDGGVFDFQVILVCDLDQVGNTYCSEAQIFALEQCRNDFTAADYAVEGRCNGDSVLFRLQNVGESPSSGPIQYIVVEDITSFAFEHDPLGIDQFFEVSLPARGQTIRLEVLQEPGNPIGAFRSKAVEGCASDGFYDQGVVTMFASADYASFISIDCQESVASFDPNDKTSQPKGIGVDKIIYAGTQLKYRLRFQNTGTDTAFNIRVVDPLPREVDIRSIQPGSASHAYRLEISDRELNFIFEDILLPDSNTNEAASHGFVNFKIDLAEDVQFGDSIRNSALIYFDFNDPIKTNQTQHILEERMLATTLGMQTYTPENVFVFPNPIYGIDIYFSASVDQAEFILFDGVGRMIRKFRIEGNRISLRSQLPNGLYLYRIVSKEFGIQTGKLIVKNY